MESEEAVFLCPPPGRVLNEEYLAPLEIQAGELAVKIGVTREEIDSLITGELPVSVEMSLRLARYFSTAADFWAHLQMEHDLEKARHRIGDKIRKEIQPKTTTD